ncbi:MAG: thermonuclease family protein [bacterium]|nr:thermonuclease family protein [bacterium]
MRVTLGIIAIVFIFAIAMRAPFRELGQHKYAPEQQATVSSTLTEESTANDSPSAQTETYPVVKVVDGDTIAISMNGKNETIRLIGLDTPETVDPRKPVQCFGEEASKKAKAILTGKNVRIEMDPSQGKRDKYGRLLAYVYMEDGTLFNKFMIAEGYGHEYTYNIPYKYQKEFKAAEKTARGEQKGLWAETIAGDCSPKPASQATPSDHFKALGSEAGFRAGGKTYDCSHNVYNCSSFKTHAEAQYVFGLCGGDKNDIHKLDRDMDGEVCESLP